MTWLRAAALAAGVVSLTSTPCAQARIVAKCVSGDGQAVAAAQVWVVQHRGAGRYETRGPFASDATGAATTCVALDYDGGCFDRWLYAYVPGKLVGALRWLRLDRNAPAHPGEPILTLGPARDVHGVVSVPAGLAAHTVTVRTLALSAIDESPFGTPFPRQHGIAGLRATLPERFDAAVDGEGKFVLRDVPQRAQLYLAAEGPGLGQAQWFNAILPDQSIPERIEITMAREVVVDAAVFGPDRVAVADAEVRLRLDRNPQRFGLLDTFAARSDAAGRVRITGLPTGEFGVEVGHPDLVMRPRELTLTGERLGRLMLELEPAIELRGVVRDAKSRAGIESVTLSAITDQERRWTLGSARSNARGEFTLRLPRGDAEVYVSYVPPGYLQPSNRTEPPRRVTVARDTKPLEFTLEPAQ